jgi:hypothetical protein
MNRVEPPERIPESMRRPSGVPGGLGSSLHDRPHASSNREQCLFALRESLDKLQKAVFPKIS